jgi:hypothetical protein
MFYLIIIPPTLISFSSIKHPLGGLEFIILVLVSHPSKTTHKIARKIFSYQCISVQLTHSRSQFSFSLLFAGHCCSGMEKNRSIVVAAAET